MVVALALLVGALTLAASGVAGAKKSKTDSAKGKGEIVQEGEGTTRTQKFKLKAKDVDKDPLTDAAKGKISFQLLVEEEGGGELFAGRLEGKVVCLRVDEGAAVLVAEVTEVSGDLTGNFQEGDFILNSVLDSGEPKGQGDLYAAGFTQSETCPAPSGAGQPITDGNITVKDVAAVAS